MTRKVLPNDWHLLSRLKLRQLHLIVALDDQRNMHRAAERLHLTQPACTRLLVQIERALGMPLFERTANGMIPTAAGVAMVQGAREVIGSLARTGDEMSAIDSGVTGLVKVGALVPAAPSLLPRTIARFKAARPRVTVVVVEGTLAHLVGMLREGVLDLVVGRLSSDLSTVGLAIQPLRLEPMRVVVRADHPLLGRRRLKLGQLTDETWVMPDREAPYRRRLEAAFLAEGAQPPVRLVESVSVLVNVALAAETDFLCVMPGNVAEPHVTAGRLAFLPVVLPDPTGPVGIIRRAVRGANPALQAFIDELTAQAARG